MVVDLGTGDGRSVLTRATRDAEALVIGVDASAQAMAEASRRAHRDGPANTLFLALGAAALADAAVLAGRVDLVTVTMPWGSLLRGVLGLDDGAVLAGIAAILAPVGRLEVLASVVPTDRVAGLDALGGGHEPAVRAAWRTAGLRLETMSPASIENVRSTGSSWARRLGAGQGSRPVWRLTGARGPGPGEAGHTDASQDTEVGARGCVEVRR